MSEPIAISKIVRDGATQSRAALNEEAIEEYAAAMRDGAQFPPIFCVYDGERYFLYDGFHRVEAANRAGLKKIDANVLPGTLADAQWSSYAMNANHGLRRTNEDKRRAIIAALKHPNGAGKSDREIGRHVGVDHKTVANLRQQLEATGEIPQSGERLGGDGRTINTTNINATRHWGLNKGNPFWKQVNRLGLNTESVLEQLQPGATHLTDLEMDAETAWHQLHVLATARNAERYPVGSYIYHFNHHIFVVQDHRPDHVVAVDAADPNGRPEGIVVDGIRSASPEEVDSYLNPPYPLGTQVMTDVSDVVGEVIALRPLMVCVRRRNPGATTNVTNWVKTENVRPAPNGDQPTPAPEPVAPPLFQVGDYVRTHTGLEGKIAKIDVRQHGLINQKTLYYLEGKAQPLYAEQLTKIDPPAPDQPPATLDLDIAQTGWLKRLTSTGLLIVANKFPNWDDLNWIERYRAIKQTLCPDRANDPLLFVETTWGEFYALDADAQAVGGALRGNDRLMYASHIPAVFTKLTGLEKLSRMGATGAIAYRELNFDIQMIFQKEAAPVVDEQPDSQPPLPPPTEPGDQQQIETQMLNDLYNFGFDEIKPLQPALQRILVYLNGLYSSKLYDELPDDLHLWREFLDRVEATAAQAVQA